jgi:hypothetical protein
MMTAMDLLLVIIIGTILVLGVILRFIYGDPGNDDDSPPPWITG